MTLLILVLLTITMLYIANLPRVGDTYRDNRSKAVCYVTRVDLSYVTVEFSPKHSATMLKHTFYKEFTRAN